MCHHSGAGVALEERGDGTVAAPCALRPNTGCVNPRGTRTQTADTLLDWARPAGELARLRPSAWPKAIFTMPPTLHILTQCLSVWDA